MFNNPWFIGIASSLVVYFITNYFANMLSRKEYNKRVREANREIIVLLIMSVSEERIPSLPIIKSLLKSLSRSFGVKEGDLNNIKETLEDLIKEIFETKFISNDKKNEISESLIELINEDEKIGEVDVTSNQGRYINTYNYIYTFFMVALTIFMAVFVLVDLASGGYKGTGFSERFILPFTIGTTIAFSVSLVSDLRKTHKGEKNNKINVKKRFKEIFK